MHRRRRAGLADVDDRDGDDEQRHHRAEDHPALARLPTMRPYIEVSAAGISRIASISTKFESHVGFSNGIAELTLKKPPPFVPSSLIASWPATGPTARVCVAAGERPWRSDAVAERLDHALGDEERAPTSDGAAAAGRRGSRA